jgi:hypothetical protein
VKRALAIALLAVGCQSPGAQPSWTTVSGLDRIVLSVWGPKSSDLWVVGGCDPAYDPKCGTAARALALHSDGSAWTERAVPVSAVLWWVWGFAANDVWVAGSGGTILHWTGAAFTAVPSGAKPAEVLYGIWGAAPDDLWAVGGVPDLSSTVLRYRNGAWAPDNSAPAANLGAYYKVWGTAANDVWLVGQNATLVHWDGAAYHVVDVVSPPASLGKRDPLFTISGRSPTDVYAVGGFGQGKAIHFDGTAWSPVAGLDLSATSGLFGVREDAAGDVSITGGGGAKFVGGGAAWRDDSTSPPSDADLHATLLFAPDDVWAVGGSFAFLNHGVLAHYGTTPVPPIAH